MNESEIARRSSSLTLHSKPDAGERLYSLLCALGGVAITLSLIGAIWATNHYREGNRTFQLASVPGERMTEPVVVTASGPMARRGDMPQNGAVGGVPHMRTWQTASAPLGWDDLSLMLRTGLTDDEVIAATTGKQLTTVLEPVQVRLLREMGAGNRLINYLQGRTVYNGPMSATMTVANAPVRQFAAPATNYAPAATPLPVVDYAARDRQIADLKRRIDALDEQMRVVRSTPMDTRYSWRYYGSYGRVDQQRYDAYCKQIDEERDNLRREKWRLEGR